MHFPAILKFDKVPEELPDWWDDEEDDDDIDKDKGGNGGEGGSGGQGGSGDGGDGGGDGKGFFAALLAMYVNAIRTNPVRTKALSTCVIALFGDMLAQIIAQSDKAEFCFDVRRSASIGIWASVFMGPVLHYWYGFLDRVFLGKFALAGKLLSDQLLFAPFFNGAFIAGVGTLEGNPLRQVADTVRTKLWPSMKANWTLWPAAQVVNFTLIPRTFQIVYVNCVALVWNVILTYISHEDS